MPRSLRTAVQPRGLAPPNGLKLVSRAISHSRCWSARDVRESSVAMLRAIWMLAPTHHSNVYCATKSPLRNRFIANGSRLAVAAFGVEVAVGLGAGVLVAL